MKTRLTVVIHTLFGGGAEYTVAQLVNSWYQRSYDVTLVTLGSAKSDKYIVSDDVHRVSLNVMSESRNGFHAIANNARRLLKLRRAILQSKPDVVVSFVDKTNTLTLLSTIGSKVPVVVSERIDPRHEPLGRIWSRLRRWSYRRCAALVVQTESVRQFMAKTINGITINVIPNCVWPTNTADSTRILKTGAHQILAVGRLAHQKGFDLLIRAFSQVSQQHADWHLTILGEGDQRTDLEQLLRDLQLESRVFLPGWVDNPRIDMQSADILVLPSRYEGFPNVLLEAMSFGRPVVSSDCPSGPNEIIQDNVNGLLVPTEDVESLAAALNNLIVDEQLRNRLGANAVNVSDRYRPDVILDQWDAVLTAAARR